MTPKLLLAIHQSLQHSRFAWKVHGAWWTERRFDGSCNANSVGPLAEVYKSQFYAYLALSSFTDAPSDVDVRVSMFPALSSPFIRCTANLHEVSCIIQILCSSAVSWFVRCVCRQAVLGPPHPPLCAVKGLRFCTATARH